MVISFNPAISTKLNTSINANKKSQNSSFRGGIPPFYHSIQIPTGPLAILQAETLVRSLGQTLDETSPTVVAQFNKVYLACSGNVQKMLKNGYKKLHVDPPVTAN